MTLRLQPVDALLHQPGADAAVLVAREQVELLDFPGVRLTIVERQCAGAHGEEADRRAICPRRQPDRAPGIREPAIPGIDRVSRAQKSLQILWRIQMSEGFGKSRSAEHSEGRGIGSPRCANEDLSLVAAHGRSVAVRRQRGRASTQRGGMSWLTEFSCWFSTRCSGLLIWLPF